MLDITAHPLNSRRVIDVAVGILVGLRRCSEEDAFGEIAQVVHQTGIPLSATSKALVALATSATEHFPHRAEVVQQWGDLLPTSGASERAR